MSQSCLPNQVIAPPIVLQDLRDAFAPPAGTYRLNDAVVRIAYTGNRHGWPVAKVDVLEHLPSYP